MGTRIKKSFHYVLSIWPLQEITWTYYISLLAKTSHYALVQNLGRLVSSQCNNTYHKKYFDQYCLHSCTSEEVLKSHLERCKLHGAQRIRFPEADDKKERGRTKFTKRNTKYVYLLSSPWSSKAFYLNKSCVSHRHQNPSPPNTSITYHVGAAST